MCKYDIKLTMKQIRSQYVNWIELAAGSDKWREYGDEIGFH
jgi:hypothetical protein